MKNIDSLVFEILCLLLMIYENNVDDLFINLMYVKNKNPN